MEQIDQIQQQSQEDIYVFIKFLGEGSFGKVNLYRNTTDNSLAVWKEIDLNRLDTKSRNEAFAEVEILSMLDHANIISYYKHFFCDNILYIELQYAKAGTLSSLIKQKKNSNEYFDQDQVLWLIYQLTNAIDYIHDMGIMHRDIKALNIFFMQSGLLKLGDFGIAKILDPNNGLLLETLVGTPFYMSPELVEGKKYSIKSDIWALGCVGYEIMTLSRVFDATNQLKLAMKISLCAILEIQSDLYSNELKDLIKQILSKDPNARPTSKDILNNKIFNSKSKEYNEKILSLDLESKKIDYSSQQSIVSSPIISSKLSECYIWGGGTRLPKQIEFFKNENAPLHCALGTSHYAVINVEKELYTWSTSQGTMTNSNAKLGHGNFGNTRIPKRVDSLNGISIEKVCCGEEFTCCLSQSGALYVFGTNLYGCLGLGSDFLNKSIDIPTRVEFFHENNLRVVSIACGDFHCIALTEDNRIFTWGCGEYGRLGHDNEDDCFEPTEIKFNFKYKFKNVYAGLDCSFLLTKEGRVLAFGNNEFNKLCLNENRIGLKNANSQKFLQDNCSTISQQLTPKLVKQLLAYNVSKICPGQNHTTCIDCFGRLLTFGNNKFGQLGVGDSKLRTGVNLVSGQLVGHFVTNASCGDTFTICSTSENHVFSWGNRKDGRLGLDSMFDDNSIICLPKPIFGSLHQVRELSSKTWNSIIIAEKELNSKSLKSVTSCKLIDSQLIDQKYQIDKQIDNLQAQTETNQEENNRNELEQQDEETFLKRKFNNNESINEMPEWLKKDLEEADYIPIEALKLNNEKQSTQLNLQEAYHQIEQLKQENFKLKQENDKVKKNLIKNFLKF